MTRIKLEFITPLFNRGAYDDRPEIRPPSIRGQLHWWMRALGGSATDEKAVFGSVHQHFGGRESGVKASKVIVRVAAVQGDGTRDFPALKHKERQGRQANPRKAFAPGTSCELQILERLGGIPDSSRAIFDITLEAWLLMGTLGLRATRAAGSFAWSMIENGPASPETWEAYEARLQHLTRDMKLKVAILSETFADAEAARWVVSDTIGGGDDRQGTTNLERLRDPLGFAKGRNRKTSPLRFRIVQIGTEYRILAVWDGRSAVTGNQPSDLKGVIDLLEQKDKRIGMLLKNSSLG
jgi:CRISPR/Cas system CMR-associated protein Cmr1 (group 7 of RAMP superfamily)